VRPRNGVVGYRDDRSIVYSLTIFEILKALSSTQGLDFFLLHYASYRSCESGQSRCFERCCVSAIET
jgi:hypothetical protein